MTSIFVQLGLSDGTVLTTVSSCICPGHEAVFECTVDAGVTTVWRGSALENCSDGTVILRHSKFDEGHTINETCGASGQVVGHAISAEDGSYTSQLVISVTQQTIGNLIQCTTDSESGSSTQTSVSTGIQLLITYNTKF